MCIVATDILSDLCGLSLGLLIALVPIGLVLWLFGWWSHRFWIVLAATVLAGVFGLVEATAWQAQPIVVAVLLAVAAGVLALALVRVITFAAGGMAGVYLVQFAMPSLQQPAICFLISGLLCLLLFRWFFMLATSFLGAAILAYGTLALLHFYDLVDAVAWSAENSTPLTILCIIAALVGFTFQFLSDRWRARRRKEREDRGEGDAIAMILGKIGFGGGGKSKRKAA
jgi:hypothetical protein